MRFRGDPKRSSFWIIFTYAILGSLWIAFSDRLLMQFVTNSLILTQLQTAKGWAYVLLTSGLLYLLIYRSQRSLQRSHSLLQEVTEGTPDAIFAKDRLGRYVMVNSTVANVIQLAIDQILGKDDRAFFPPNIAQQIIANDQAILASGISQSLEETVTTPEGQRRVFWSTKYVWRDQQGEIQGIIGISRDITEHKHLEQERQQLIEELQQQTRDLQALSVVTANAISTLNLDELLVVLLERIVSVMGVDAAIILLCQNQFLQAKAGAGVTESELSCYDSPLGEGFAGMIASRRCPLYVEDIHADARFHYLLPERQCIRSLLGVPLQRNNHLVGVLQVEWHQAHPRSDREIHLLEITAERCTLAIINAQLYEQTRQLQEQLQLQVDRMPIGCILHDHQFRITDWNPAAQQIFGYTKAEVLGKESLELMVPPAIKSQIDMLLQRIATGDMTAHSLNENCTKDGKLILCEWNNTPLINSAGRFVGLLSMVQDVTERRRAEEQLWRYAFYDTLTGLPQRKLLLQRLQCLLQNSQSDRNVFTLFHLDVDRFQVVKHSLGHHIAEQLLVAVADRLESCLNPPAMLARVEASEFVILAEGIADLNAAMRFAEQIQQTIAASFYINEHEVFTTVSVGIVLSSAPLSEPADLLRAADTAMHHAKASHTLGYAVFDAEMQAEAIRRLRIDTDLRRALDNQELQIYYQPIVSLLTQDLVGFEALLRWHHPQLGFLSPGEFIPLAEESGLITSLGMWVLRQACDQVRRWQQQFPQHANLTLSVNLSPIQLKQPDVLDQMNRIFQETNFRPHQLKLEITESAVMENTRWITEVLERLKAEHVGLSIDDFGTGYSSLSYLHSFSFDVLKIDRSFINYMSIDHQSLEIVHTIILLAQILHMQVVAEGIETIQQWEHLRTLGCELGQGYLFSRPVNAIAIERLIQTEQWKI